MLLGMILEPSPLVPGPPQSHREALREEGEDVEDRGLAAAVGAEEGGEGREGLDLQVAERPVVLDPDRFDPRDGPSRAFLVGHGRDSEGWFCGILGEISFGRVLWRWVWIIRILVRLLVYPVLPSPLAKELPNLLK